MEFQTHPCGVEVTVTDTPVGAAKLFQTHPCGVEVALFGGGFDRAPRFQTHPCGVEVRPDAHVGRRRGVSDAPLWG